MVKSTRKAKDTKKGVRTKTVSKTKTTKRASKTTKKKLSTVFAEPKKRGRPRKLEKLKNAMKRGRPKKQRPSFPGTEPDTPPPSFPTETDV